MLTQTEKSVRSLSARGEARSRDTGPIDAIARIPKTRGMGKRSNEEFRCYPTNAAALLTRTIG